MALQLARISRTRYKPVQSLNITTVERTKGWFGFQLCLYKKKNLVMTYINFTTEKAFKARNCFKKQNMYGQIYEKMLLGVCVQEKTKKICKV
jgi:hypothetical protein